MIDNGNLRRIGKLILFSCAAAGALGLSQAVAAEAAAPTPSAAEVEQVIVTARRKEENLQSVPVSVNAVSAAQLQRQSIANMYDLQRAAPGLTVSPSALGAARPAYELRGQRTAATRISGDPAIVVYFAEVGSSRAAGSAQSLFDIDSVQVLKGPQGTLFGRNSTGGAILITPKAPTGEFGGYGMVQLGNFGHRTYEGMVNLPVNDQLAFRLAGQVHRRDGYMKNGLLIGRRAMDEDYSSYRISAKVKPTDSITSDFIATYFYMNTTGYQGALTGFVPAAFPVPALVPVLQAELAATKALGFYGYRASIPGRFKNNVKGVQNNTVIDLGDGGSLLGDARLKNIIAYKQLRDVYTANADATALGIFNSIGTYRGKQLSEELQLQGDNGFVDYVLGAYYTVESGDDYQNAIQFGALPRTITELYGKNRSGSVFAHGNFDLSSVAQGLTFSAGGRITKDKRFIDTHTRQQRAPTPAVPTGVTCSFPTPTPIANFTDRSLCSVKTHASFTEPTWDIGLNYQIDPDHMVYLAHRHGYRSGVAPTGIAPLIRPEKVNDIEVGSKNQFMVGDASARFNLVGFYGKYKDLQRNIAVIINGQPSTADRNAAKAHVYGLESDLNVRFSPAVSVNAAYALTIAKYDEYSNTFNTAAGPVTVDNTSSKFAYTPKHAITANVVFDLPLDEDMGSATVSVGYSYQSKIQAVEANTLNCGPIQPTGLGIERWCLNTPFGTIKSYGLVNARADWRKPFGAPFDVGLFATNLADKKYISSTITLVNIFGTSLTTPGAPRMVGVELRVPFGAE